MRTPVEVDVVSEGCRGGEVNAATVKTLRYNRGLDSGV